MLFDTILGLFSRDLAINLGSSTTTVYVRGEQVRLNEPSMVAVRRGTRKVVAVGTEAKRLLGRCPEGIEVIRPVRGGVVADFDIAHLMLSRFVQQVHQRRHMVAPLMVIVVPGDMTPVERRAAISVAERAGARRVFLLEAAKAAGIGAGRDIEQPRANLVVVVGAGTTEIAVLTLSNVAVKRSIRVGGDTMDAAIVSFLRQRHGILVGDATAERLKKAIGSAWDLEEEINLEVGGRHIGGDPHKVVVSSEDIREALREPIDRIIRAIRECLEETPPELCGDIVERGITLCGGASRLLGLNYAIEAKAKVEVHSVEDAEGVVIAGAGMYLEDLERYATLSMEAEAA